MCEKYFPNIRDIKNIKNSSDILYKIYRDLLDIGYSTIELSGYEYNENYKKIKNITNLMREKGFYVHECEFSINIAILPFNFGYREHAKRLEPIELMYLIYRRYKSFHLLEKYLFLIIEEYLT